jgi:hypothetical protein
MSTRTIVTSQPDVACDVCTRRLLRGEQPDVFVVAGERRLVCELCAPRAAHEGWTRETEAQPIGLPPLRPRRGRGLFDRLLGVARPVTANGGDGEAAPEGHDVLDAYADTQAPLATGNGPRARPPRRARRVAVSRRDGWEGDQRGVEQAEAQAAVAAEPPSSYVDHALIVFNASEFPRRVAGVARSLGPPAVTVRSAEHLDSVVSIVVAWELCWYRYEVDLSEPGAQAQAIGQGTELGELAREDRLANAAASESGTLALA